MNPNDSELQLSIKNQIRRSRKDIYVYYNPFAKYFLNSYQEKFHTELRKVIVARFPTLALIL